MSNRIEAIDLDGPIMVRKHPRLQNALCITGLEGYFGTVMVEGVESCGVYELDRENPDHSAVMESWQAVDRETGKPISTRAGEPVMNHRLYLTGLKRFAAAAVKTIHTQGAAAPQVSAKSKIPPAAPRAKNG